MEQLYKLIKTISSNNFITKTDGIFIPIDNINKSLLAKHRDAINSLCTDADLQFNTIPPKTVEVDEPQYSDSGDFIGLEKVTKFVVDDKGYEQKGGFWIGKSRNTLDAFAQALGG
tara:strand:+ start:916 stop:1260 length:345 start_codon:yes stop_codon:yes gene_type:complete